MECETLPNVMKNSLVTLNNLKLKKCMFHEVATVLNAPENVLTIFTTTYRCILTLAMVARYSCSLTFLLKCLSISLVKNHNHKHIINKHDDMFMIMSFD